MSGERTQLGIDLGTTNSAVALGTIPEDGKPDIKVIKNERGNLVTPSMVYYESDGTVRVGEPAKGMFTGRAERVVAEIKREMETPDYTVEVGDEEYTPVEVSAEILRHMKSVAESVDAANLDSVDEVVVTVPAYFENLAKKRTEEAAEAADIDVSYLAKEPVAAATVYDETGTLLVYDFGGGTLDIALVEAKETPDGREFETVDFSGDMQLGGKDFDEKLTDHIVEEYNEENGVDISTDERMYNQLRIEVERAKQSLSADDTASVLIPALGQIDGEPVGIDREIHVDEFEDVVSELLDRARDPLEELMDRQGLDSGDVDDVLLVGGSTRIPAVQDLVEDITGVDPTMDIAPDRAVARGAAIVTEPEEGDEVLPRSIGVKIERNDENRVAHLLERGTKTPCEASDIFTTSEDDQTAVNVEIYEGEGTDPDGEDVTFLGDGTLSDINPAPAGEPEIEVTFSVGTSGILEVTADDLEDPENEVTIDLDLPM